MKLLALIPLIPFIGFLINGIGFKKISNKLIPIIGIAAAILSFIGVLITFFTFEGTALVIHYFDWINVGTLKVNFAFQIDQLTLVMLLIITGVGSLIHIYSAGYMHDDEGIGKFFAYLNLFLFSMIILVIGANYLMMFIGWEGVGLCSYLLIGFWNKNIKFADAARKAFIMNRIGDLGFLIGIFLIFQNFGTIEYLQVFEKAQEFPIGSGVITVITLALFIGAIGKSAQIPLFTWLPDAMAGPTPVSALIHAATMVTSGIYMIVRSNVLYTLAPATLEFVAWTGLATALLGATIGLFQNDIKKVLAYSTVSQLGYMFLGLGVMTYTSGLFHVMTHAFFKALLFLGAGSVIHAMGGEQDIRKMGGFWPKIKVTAITFLIGTIAISGIPPFAGFFSKDEILAHVYVHNKLMWALALAGSFMTAFYMFRLFFLTFFGEFRGTKDQEHHLHESPKNMTVPLIILGVLSAFAGFLGMPEVMSEHSVIGNYLNPIYRLSQKINPHGQTLEIGHGTEWMLMFISVIVALLASLWAFVKFGKGKNVPMEDSKMGGLSKLIYDKYYIDEFYNKLFVSPIKSISKFLGNIFDVKIVDGLVESLGNLVPKASTQLRKLQVGNISSYLLFITIGIILILVFGLIPNVFAILKSVVNK